MRRVSYSLILIVILILVSSCRVGIKTTTDINYQQQLLAATLFQQCAAEMKALSYQAYNIAGGCGWKKRSKRQTIHIIWQ